jgi:tetratricopeptide (TPR) repeat protein
MLRRILRAVLVAAVALVPAAPALAADAQIVVYNKGKILRYDPDVGAELKEIILETYDIAEGKLVKKETIEAYFFLSDDKEIITPEAITDEARQKFVIEKKSEKYFFGGMRDKAITIEEANAAAPAPTKEDAINAIESKVKRIAKEVVKIDPKDPKSAAKRKRIITAEFTESLKTFGEQELTDVTGFVVNDPKLSENEKFYVLRSFGFTFFDIKDYRKAVFFYEKCIEISPDSGTAYYQKAVAHERGGEPDQAIRSYVKALAIRPRDNITRLFLKFLGATSSTERLDGGKIGELKAKVGEIDGALKKKDQKGATDIAHALEETVEGWYGGGAPERPKPAPGGGGGATAPPGGDDPFLPGE